MTALTVRCHEEPLAVGLVPAYVNVALTGGTAPIRGSLATSEGRTIIFPYHLASEAGPDVRVEGPFRALELAGPIEFGLPGVLQSLLGPLAEAEVSVFVLSTFDTDWLLVPAGSVDTAGRALAAAGHTVISEESQ